MFRTFFIYLVLLISSFFLLVSTTYAAQMESGETVVLSKDVVIEDNYFVAGETVTISGTILGDLYVAGGTVNIEGVVEGDLYIAGGRVDIRGSVGEDVIVAGGQISISGDVIDDVTAVGGSIAIADSAVIGDSVVAAGGDITIFSPIPGSATFAAGNVEIANTIEGDVVAAVGNLTLTPNGSITGDVTYYSENEINIPQDATVSGDILRKEPPQYKEKMEQDVEDVKNTARGASMTLKIINLISALLVGFLVIHFFPKYVGHVTARVSGSPWQSVGVGLLFLFILPIVIILLFVTVIGMPIALILLFTYFFYIYLAKIFVSIMLAATVLNYFKKKYSMVVTLAIGLILYLLVTSIPLIGWLVSFVAVIVGVGANILGKKDYYSELKSKKVI